MLTTVPADVMSALPCIACVNHSEDVTKIPSRLSHCMEKTPPLIYGCINSRSMGRVNQLFNLHTGSTLIMSHFKRL